MGKFLDYLFNNSHYKEVKQAYELVYNSSLKTAFGFWQRHLGLALGDSYEDMEYIFDHISEIKSVNNWIEITNRLTTNQRKGVEWLYSVKRGKSAIPAMDYKEYEFVATNESNVKTYDRYYITYKRLLSSNREAILWLYSDSFAVQEIPAPNYKEIEFIATNETKIKQFQHILSEYNRISKSFHEACERWINKKLTTLSFNDKKRIANSETRIKEIDEELKRVKNLRKSYPLAWQLFSNGKSWENMTITKLKSADENAFKVKEEFIKSWNESPERVKLIMGVKKHPITSFSNEVIEKEQSVLDYMAISIENEFMPFSMSIHLETSDELKRAIMDSEDYGKKCSFSDSYSISNFYSLREDFDKIGVNFDDAIKREKENDFAVRAFNKEKYGKEVSYIEDYLRIVTKDHPLYSYVEEYKKEKEKRDKAKVIQCSYSLGFKAIFGNKNLDECTLLEIINIVDSENRIRNKNVELEAIERQRREEEEKHRTINNLRSCVSSWHQPNRSTVNCFSLYYYYPTTCGWNASEDEWNVRNLIWDFKANPNKPQSESEIQRRHEEALNSVLPKLEKVIDYYFRQDKSKLTLVCIPSSKRIVTERRYRDLAQKLCNATGMSNGYPYVSVISDGEARHLGGSSSAQFRIDSSYFKDRYILLFDDVITSGASMEAFKRTIESVGGIIIGGLSIGKTKHERQSSNPMDFLR